MKKTTILLAIVLGIINFCPAQTTVESGKFDIELLKAKNVSRFEIHSGSYFIKVSRNAKRIQVKVKVESRSKNKETLDLNKFYLVSDKFKIRLQPLDIRHSQVINYAGVEKLVHGKPSERSTFYAYYSHKPEVEDSFLKFKIPGYTDVRNRIDFGTKRKPDVKFTYYDLKKIKQERFNIYFAVPRIFENGTLYYGNHKIGKIQVKPKKPRK